MNSRSGYCGTQPSSWRMRSDEATSTAGSPGRRGPTTAGIGCPVTRHAVSTTSLTGVTRAVAQVAAARAELVNRLQRQQVRLGEFCHMDVVAHTCAVAGGVVVAEDGDMWAMSERHLQHQRDQVRLRVVVFAAVGQRARSVEIAQGDVAQAVDAV